MAGDLPVGQSKGLPGPLIEVLDAYEARIRAQVAEDIAREIEQVVGGFPLNGLRRPKLERGLHVSDAVWAARIARKHGAKDSDSSPAALTDVVGTPDRVWWLHRCIAEMTWYSGPLAANAPPPKECPRCGVSVDNWFRATRVDRLPEE